MPIKRMPYTLPASKPYGLKRAALRSGAAATVAGLVRWLAAAGAILRTTQP